jgi:hypothetical protein
MMKEITLVGKQIRTFCFDEWAYFQCSLLLERYKNSDMYRIECALNVAQSEKIFQEKY